MSDEPRPGAMSERDQERAEWQACRRGSCQSYSRCMYRPCDNVRDIIATALVKDRIAEMRDHPKGKS